MAQKLAIVLTCLVVIGCRGAGSHHSTPQADADSAEPDAEVEAEGERESEHSPECTWEQATGSDCPFGEVCDMFILPPKLSGDILIVVDTSGSIDPAGEMLTSNLGGFFRALEWTDVHIHVGIISASTEALLPGTVLRYCAFRGRTCYPGR